MDKSYACILIADATLQDLPMLLADLPASVHVRLVHSASEALGEFWQALASAGLAQLHWLSHGMPGGVVVAGQALTAADFCQRFDGAAERDLDVAFWSCHTGAGEPGRAFVEALTRATGARVAASAVEVGAGFWQLSPAVNAPFSARAQLEFSHTLPAPAQFASSVTYQASQEVGGLALGDLNGDGALDIQTAGIFNDASTLLNNGTGSFTHDINANGQADGEWGCELADLNGDGHLDLVSRTYSAVVVNRGSAQNGFTNKQYYLQNETVYDAIVAQVNNDSRFDLLVSRTIQGQHMLSVFLGQSDGTLAAPVNSVVSTGAELDQLHATDLNNDGKQDIIALSYGNTISVLMNNGDGTFANSVSYQEGDYQNQFFNLTSADVNGDGYQDVIAVDIFAGSVSVKLNQGNGLLGPASHYATGTAPTDIVAVDLNGDGAVDLATANMSSVSVLLGNGDGSFAAKQDIQLDTLQNHIRAGDLNQDGKQDLVVGSYSGNSVSVLLNTTGSVDSIAPVVSRLEVAGTSLIVHYTEITQLDAVHPPALSQFAAKINNSPVALTGAPVVDAAHHTVTLTLGTPVALGQTVSLSYTDASTNNDVQAVQDVAGNDAASFTLTTAPMAAVRFSADTGVSDSDLITFQPVQTLSGHLQTPTVDGQTVQVSVNNGMSWETANHSTGQTYWSLDQSLLGQSLYQGPNVLKVRLHTASSNTEVASQDYDLTWSGRIFMESGSVNGNNIKVQFSSDLPLDASHPPSLDSFEVLADNVAVALSGVAVVDGNARTLTLTLANPVLAGQQVLVKYNDPMPDNGQFILDAMDALQDIGGADAMDGMAMLSNYTPDITAPVFGSASINGSKLVLSYADVSGLNDNNGPLLSAFSVKVDNSVVALTGTPVVNSGGKTITLTLVNSVLNGQAVTVSYTDPTSGNDSKAIQDMYGNDAASLAQVTVNNLTPIDITPPVLTSATINGKKLVLSYADASALHSQIPLLSAFSVNVAGNAVLLSGGVPEVDTAAKTVTLTLINPVLNGQVVTVSYTDPTSGNDSQAIQDVYGNDAASLNNVAVSNITPVDTTPPVLTSATVSGHEVVLSYTDTNVLSSQGPLLSAFSVKLAGSVATLSGAPVVNTTAKTITLTLATPAQNGQAVTLSYTDPTSGNDSQAIQDASGNDAASLNNIVVSNLTPLGDVTPPVLTSATVNGDQVLLSYTDSNPLKSSMGGLYVIKVDGVVAQTYGMTANPSNNTILITLANAVLAGQVVTFSYTDPTSGNDLLAIQDVAGNDAASVVDFSVSNLTVPTYQMAAGETSYTVTATQYNVMGNALDNLMTGDSKPNNLMGGAGNDTLLGGGNNGDRLYGEAGNDVLNSGLGGSHRLVGGSGDDRYEIAYLATLLVEQPDEGNDSVYVMPGANLVVSLITLSANIENLIAKNSEHFNVIGNASDNYLLGNQASGLLKGLAGNDTLISQGGDDTLEGGDGDDVIAPVAHSHMTENTRVLTGNMQLSGGNGADIFVMAEGFVGDHKDGWNPNEFSGNYYSPSQPVGIQGVYISDFERGVDKISLTLSEAALVPTTVNTLTLTAGMTLASAVDQAASRGSAAAPQVTIILNQNVGCAYLVLDQSDASTFSSNDLAIKLNYSMPLGIGDLMFTKLSQQNQLLPAESAPPVFTQASVNGNQLVLSYSDASPLDSVVPPLGAFAVMVNGNAASVSAASVNSLARTVTLTLASPVQNGQAVTVSYTDPSSGNDSAAIQDRYGNDAASLAATPVNNLTPPADVTPPVLQSASLTDSTLVLTYSDTSPLDAAHPPALSAFNVKVAGVTVSLTGAPVVNATARTVTLTLADPVLAGQAVTVSYTDPSSGNDAQAVQDGSGNDAQTVLNRVVSNLGTNTSYVMDATTVNYTATGTAALTIQGNALNNQITGNAADNVIRGGQGNDRLLGGLGNDQLLGEEGSDSLDGGAGSDTLSGGAGNDAYYVDSVDDQIIEQANDSIADTVYASINYTLGNDLEHLVLMGQATQGQGNALANSLTGNALANTLTGLAGDDRIDGKQGADTMVGGIGNDYYYVDQAGDSVIELANEGNDTIYAYLDYTLGANQEGLNLLGTLAVVGQGNELGNMLNGNALANTLTGLAGDDRIDGKQGADTLIGGLGNDTYYVDNAADVVTEQANEGVDTVYASVSHTLADNVETLRMTADGQTAMGNAANNVIYGSAGQDVLIDGGAGNDTIYTLGDKGGEQHVHGGLGNDTLYVGGTLANGDRGSYVYGDAGDDTLNATQGDVKSDLMGGAGNDTYVINNIHNRVIENVNDGYDTVQTSVSFSLQAGEMFIPDSVDVPATTGNLERLLMTGTANIDGFGNELVNYLLGNAGNNVLLGRDGADTLVGQGGNDLLDGGNGNDTLAPVTHASSLGTPNVHTGQITLTGGNGSDVFWMTQGYVGDHSSGGNTLTLSDFVHGQDKVKFTLSLSATLPTTLTTLTPSGGATLASLLNQAAVAGSASAPKVTAFAFAGDTYLVLDQTSASSFTSDDLAIKLSGTPAFTFSDLAFVKM